MTVVNEKTMGDGPGYWAIFEYVFGIFYFLSVVVIKIMCANQTEKEVSVCELYCFIPSFIMAIIFSGNLLE